jgi:8-oxo-dGTP pyrophosphatase MutT (NUDIX family)
MVLVTKAWLGDGKWSLPGGGMHRHETPLEGAQRELYEEAGLRLKDAELNAKGKNHFDHHGLVFNYYLFVAEASEQYPLKRQHFEIAKIAWVKATQLSMSNARPDVLEALGAWSS